MIHLEINGLPLSSNHAYMTRGRKRILTTPGRKYKTETLAYLSQHYRRELTFFKKDKPYLIAFRFWCTSILNSKWKPGSEAHNRYKKFDGGNLTKLLEDVLKDAGGIDDSQTVISIWQKKEGPAEKTEIWAWCLEEENEPFDIDYLLGCLR